MFRDKFRRHRKVETCLKALNMIRERFAEIFKMSIELHPAQERGEDLPPRAGHAALRQAAEGEIRALVRGLSPLLPVASGGGGGYLKLPCCPTYLSMLTNLLFII